MSRSVLGMKQWVGEGAARRRLPGARAAVPGRTAGWARLIVPAGRVVPRLLDGGRRGADIDHLGFTARAVEQRRAERAGSHAGPEPGSRCVGRLGVWWGRAAPSTRVWPTAASRTPSSRPPPSAAASRPPPAAVAAPGRPRARGGAERRVRGLEDLVQHERKDTVKEEIEEKVGRRRLVVARGRGLEPVVVVATPGPRAVVGRDELVVESAGAWPSQPSAICTECVCCMCSS